MNAEDWQHVQVVFLQVAVHAPLVPVPRRRAYRVDAVCLRVERRRGVKVAGGVAALKLRHLDDLAAIGFGKAEDVVLSDEVLQLGHNASNVPCQLLCLAVGASSLPCGDSPVSSKMPCS